MNSPDTGRSNLASGTSSAEETPFDTATLDRLMGFRLRFVNIHLARQFSIAAAGYALRSGEYTALAVIVRSPGRSQNDVCRLTGLDKSAAVAVIDDLRKRRWIVRARSSEDRRRHALTATDEGRQALADLVSRTRLVEEPVLSVLSEAEREQLFTLLDKMAAHVLAGSK